MGDERPALGFEYEIALAKVNLANDVSFTETPYPAIVGTFEVIACTKEIRCNPPVNQTKFIANGYSPAGHAIPAQTVLGTVSFDGQDKAKANQAMSYYGETCVMRVVTSIDGAAVRTFYCNYLTPRIEVRAPEGDGVGTVSLDGQFSYLVIP